MSARAADAVSVLLLLLMLALACLFMLVIGGDPCEVCR